jgi:SPP1 gp7 family putative phage head morphogenesis protein
MPRRGGGNDTGIPADPNEFTEAVEKFRARVPMPKAEWNKLRAGQKEFAFTVAEVALADLLTEVFEGLKAAIAKGTTFEEFKATIGPKLEEHWGGTKPGRLDTIFRTNVLGAYNGGRHVVISAPDVKRFRPYRRFDGIDDDRQTEICNDCDGTILPADDPWWLTHTPGLHFNCRSVVTPLSDDEAKAEGIDEPPPVKPAEGFGVPPALDGPDWEPDLNEYPEGIREELKKRINERPSGNDGPVAPDPPAPPAPKKPLPPPAPPPAPPPEPKTYGPTLPNIKPEPAPRMRVMETPVLFDTNAKTGGDFVRRNNEALTEIAGHVQAMTGVGLGVKKTEPAQLRAGAAAAYDFRTQTTLLGGDVAQHLAGAMRKGELRTAGDKAAVGALLHETFHGMSHPDTWAKGWDLTSPRMAIEEATTELLAKHYRSRFATGVLKLKDVHPDSEPLFAEGTANFPPGFVRAAKVTAYPDEVVGFAAMVAHVDGVRPGSGDAGHLFDAHVAGRAMQVKALPGGETSPADNPRWGLFASAILKRHNVATNDPKAVALGRDISTILAGSWATGRPFDGKLLDQDIARAFEKHGVEHKKP